MILVINHISINAYRSNKRKGVSHYCSSTVLVVQDVRRPRTRDGCGAGFRRSSVRVTVAGVLVPRADGEPTAGRAEELDPGPASHR